MNNLIHPKVVNRDTVIVRYNAPGEHRTTGTTIDTDLVYHSLIALSAYERYNRIP